MLETLEGKRAPFHDHRVGQSFDMLPSVSLDLERAFGQAAPLNFDTLYRRTHSARTASGCREARPQTWAGALSAEGEYIPEIAELCPNAGQELEPKAFREELKDRRRVIDRVVDESLLCKRRRDEGRDA